MFVGSLAFGPVSDGRRLRIFLSSANFHKPISESDMFRAHVVNLQVLRQWADRQDIRHNERIAILAFIRDHQAYRPRRRRTCWTVTWLTFEQRITYGMYHQLMHELERNHVPGFVRLMRMEPAMFREMERRLYDALVRDDTIMRNSISPGERLAVTIRYLATGETFRSLSFSFRIAHNTISGIIPQVCEALINEFGPEVMPQEITVDDYKDIADGFEKLWNFPNVMGAIDGKHVPITCPKNGGSHFFNYKKFHSIILLAVVDAHYKFRSVVVGANGACSDLQVFEDTPMKQKIDRGEMEWPEPSAFPHDDNPLPHFFIADDAFPLQEWLMKPYSRRHLTKQEQIFNYRLSRARRVVENAFGILVKRFRVLLKTMEVGPKQASTITLTCCILHNVMRVRYPTMQNPYADHFDHYGRLIRGGWRDRPQLIGGQNLPAGNFGTQQARQQRDYIRDYFNSRRGSVSWQNKMVNA